MTRQPWFKLTVTAWNFSLESHGNRFSNLKKESINWRHSVFLPIKLEVDIVNDLLTFLLSVAADVTSPLLNRQTSPKSPRMLVPDSWLSRPLPILRRVFTCTSQPADLCAILIRDHTRPFSCRIHPHGHVYVVKEFLCSHSLSSTVHLELECLLPGNLSPDCTVFEIHWQEPPGIRLPCRLIQVDKVNLNLFSLSSLLGSLRAWSPSTA